MSASFQVEEAGPRPPDAGAEVPPPEELMSEEELKQQFLESASEPMKALLAARAADRAPPGQPPPLCEPREARAGAARLVPRHRRRFPTTPAIHKCVLAYASDMMLLDTSLYPHGRTLFDRDLQVASLDHALWFHRPFRADDWLLYAQDSPTASGGRGFNRGAIFTPRRHPRRLGGAGGPDPGVAGEELARAPLPLAGRGSG